MNCTSSIIFLINHESIVKQIIDFNDPKLTGFLNLSQIPKQIFHNLINGNQILLINFTKYNLIVKYLPIRCVGHLKLAKFLQKPFKFNKISF